MTARLGRWLEKLNEAESRLNKIPRIRQYGRLTRYAPWLNLLNRTYHW